MPEPVLAKPRVRVFFAALADAATRAHMAVLADSLPLDSRLRLVRRENHHVTLVFVGEIPAARVLGLREIGAARRTDPFALRFDALEYWPAAGAVVAVASVIAPALERLHRELCRELEGHRYTIDSAPLRPHITLARKVSQAPVLQAMSPVDWTVREFSLMRSDTAGAQSAYTVVDTWPLLDRPAE